MPKKKNKNKLLLKPIPPEKEPKVKHFQPPVDKQLAIKDYSNLFQQWNSWQRRILMCQCTTQGSIHLLTSLSTIMEPVFHRDHQICTTGVFDSKLLRSISSSQKPEVGEDYTTSSKKNEKWLLPITQINPTESLYNITDTIVKHKSPFNDIVLDDLPKKELINHKHESQKNRDSITTIDFFWKYQTDKLQNLGDFVKVRKHKNLPNGKKDTVNEYKHKSWYLPPINKNQSLLKASKIDLLKSFKISTGEILASYRKWSHAVQGDFILSLLGICTPSELTFFGNCVQQRLSEIGDINRLSDGVLLKIFSYLGQTDLYNCSLTCERWKSLAFHNSLWKGRCYALAEQYNQHAVLQFLEKSSVMLWKDVYKELNETITQLLDNMMLEQLQTSDDNDHNDEAEENDTFENYDDSDIEGNDDIDGDYYEEMSDSLSGSMTSSFEKIEIVHLSPNKSFATFIASESSKDSLEEDAAAYQKTNSPGDRNSPLTQNGNQSPLVSEEINELAFDVRSRLVQPMNMVGVRIFVFVHVIALDSMVCCF